MSRAKFDPEGMASFFVRLEQQSRLYGNQVPEFLRTHPVNTTRISEARMRAASLPKVKLQAPPEFSMMQARSRVLTSDRTSQALEHFKGQLAADADAVGARYGLAMAYLRLGEHARAAEALKPLLEAHPRQANLALLKGRIQLAQGDTAGALATLSRNLEYFPRYAPAILDYADALIAARKPDEARQVLLSHEQQLGTRIETYRLLAYAARDAGQTTEAQYQMANYLFERGDGPGALAQLDAALRVASLSPQERAKLRARRGEIAELSRGQSPYPQRQPEPR
jgi:predicted Zn-dependent protease